MKKVVFVCHDPGGYDVVSPVYELMRKEGVDCAFFPLGPSAQLANMQTGRADILIYLKQMIDKQEIALLVTGTSWGTDIELKCIDMCNKSGVYTIAILDYCVWFNIVATIHHCCV